MLCFLLSDEELEETVLRPGWKFSQLLQNWHGEETAKSSNTVTSVHKDTSRCSETPKKKKRVKKICAGCKTCCVSAHAEACVLNTSSCDLRVDRLAPTMACLCTYTGTPSVCVCTYMCVWLSVHTFFMCNHVLSECSCCRVFVLQLKAEEGKFVWISGDGEVRAEAQWSVSQAFPTFLQDPYPHWRFW